MPPSFATFPSRLSAPPPAPPPTCASIHRLLAPSNARLAAAVGSTDRRRPAASSPATTDLNKPIQVPRQYHDNVCVCVARGRRVGV